MKYGLSMSLDELESIAVDMIRRYGKGAGKRASDRSDDAQTYETAYKWERVVGIIRRMELERRD